MKYLFNVLTLLVALSVSQLEALPTQVVIIRHGEKNPANAQLLPKGQSRAGALASYLTIRDTTSTNPPLFTFGPPQAFYAARPTNTSDDQTVRCIQTLIPTAVKQQLPIHSPYGPGQEVEFANFILSDPRYDGKYVLICWHHTYIAALITAFGYLPPAGIVPTYPNRFDLVWLLPMPAPFPEVVVNPILQELMFGDSTTFP